jgi:hypothetical protein
VTREVRQEDEGAFEDAYQVHAIGMVAMNLLRKHCDPVTDLLGGDQNAHRKVN